MRSKTVSTSIAAAIMSLSLGTSFATASTVSAATTNAVQVVSAAYMISQPKLHSGRIQLEPAGTQLTLLPGGNRYWYHVQAPDGKTGYITTTSRWTKEITVATASTTPSTNTLQPVTSTSNEPTVDVVRSAYIISQPKLHSGRIQLEHAGTQLTLLSGGNRYWYHVQAPNGQTGYITTTSYYTKEEVTAPASTTAPSSNPSTGSSGATSSTSSTSTTAPTTSSSNGPVVEVVKNAYIISQPKLGSSRVALEQVGTQLTLESGGNRYWYHVQAPNGQSGYITTSSTYTKEVSGANVTTVSLPPGVTLDPSITPIAPPSASSTDKFNAILSVAKSKLGTPYRWGHNEDRGQYGFDCSNYVEYVYHHALGYYFTTSSRKQYTSVGTKVPTSDMQPGDLLCFNSGGHSGIYIGNGQMIQCGGGLGKVGYLNVAPGSYWYNHISAVKRMY